LVTVIIESTEYNSHRVKQQSSNNLLKAQKTERCPAWIIQVPREWTNRAL